MPAFHAYFPSAADRDEAWAFTTVTSGMVGDGVTSEVRTNPFTTRANLRVRVDGVYHLTFAFESGEAVDADLYTITGVERAGFSRIRVLTAPDPDNHFDHVGVQVLALFDRIGPVLVYGTDAETVHVDTLPTALG